MLVPRVTVEDFTVQARNCYEMKKRPQQQNKLVVIHLR